MRTLTLEEARAIVLKGQGLSAPFESPLEAVRACVAVQTQYAVSLPVAIASRVRAPKPHWDGPALAHNGPIVKCWTLRRTLHAQLREDHRLVLSALGKKFNTRYVRWMAEKDGFDLKSVEKRILQALDQGPLTRSELHEIVPELKTLDYAGWGMDVMGLAFQGHIAVTGRGSEQRFARVTASLDHERALEELLLRYLQSYGPATLKDFSYWTGLGIGDVKHAFDAVGDRIEEIRVEGLVGHRFILRCAEPTDPAPQARLLAKFDPLTMAHSDKSLILSEGNKKAVFRKAGQVEAAVLLKGEIAATWRMSTTATSLICTIEPIRRLLKSEQPKIEKEASRLAKAIGKPGVQIEFKSEPFTF